MALGISQALFPLYRLPYFGHYGCTEVATLPWRLYCTMLYLLYTNTKGMQKNASKKKKGESRGESRGVAERVAGLMLPQGSRFQESNDGSPLICQSL